MIQFFETAMGRRFYESTMPELVEQLKKLNSNIEKLIEQNKEKEDGKHEAGPR